MGDQEEGERPSISGTLERQLLHYSNRFAANTHRFIHTPGRTATLQSTLRTSFRPDQENTTATTQRRVRAGRPTNIFQVRLLAVNDPTINRGQRFDLPELRRYGLGEPPQSALNASGCCELLLNWDADELRHYIEHLYPSLQQVEYDFCYNPKGQGLEVINATTVDEIKAFYQSKRKSKKTRCSPRIIIRPRHRLQYEPLNDTPTVQIRRRPSPPSSLPSLPPQQGTPPTPVRPSTPERQLSPSPGYATPPETDASESNFQPQELEATHEPTFTPPELDASPEPTFRQPELDASPEPTFPPPELDVSPEPTFPPPELDATPAPHPGDHVRRRLVEQQDMEYAISLSTDMNAQQERDRLANERRLSAARNRERRRALLAGLDEEPPEGEGVNVQFRLPERVLSRRFAQGSATYALYRFVRGSTVQPVISLVFAGVVLAESESTLEDQGITRDVTIHVSVDDLNESGNSDRSVEIVEDQDSDIRNSLFERLLPSGEPLTVGRPTIVEDLVKIYTETPDIVHNHVTYQFRGESGQDIMGITREVFTVFFVSLFASPYFSGADECIPLLDHRILFSGFFAAVGRIISHAYVLVGYFPIRLSKAMVLLALTGKCPTDVVIDSFLKCLSPSERQLLHRLRAGNSLSEADMSTLIVCLSANGSMRSPSRENIHVLLSEVARTSIVCKPAYILAQLASGLRCYPSLWHGTTHDSIDNIYTSLAATPASVYEIIDVDFTEPNEEFTVQHVINLRSLEERVSNYLEQYVHSLSCDDLKVLLRFWTGADVLIVPRLRVSFNSLEGLQRRPTASTCVSQLMLSRYYFSYEEFHKEMNLYTRDPRSERFDFL